jgi:LacI family transcriptional regulator
VSAKKISLADIASSLGVSKSTVSFVLNDKGDHYNISKETQEAVRKKAKELNYVPNFFAKGLREGKTKTVGLIVPDVSNITYAEITKIIQNELFTFGYNAFIVNTNDDKNLELELISELINRSIDGLILVRCNEINDLKPILDNTPIPVVFLDRIADQNGDYVGIDNEREAYLLVNKFKIKPKKLGVYYTETQASSTQNRIDGSVKACNELDVPYILLNNENFNEEVVHVDSVLALNKDAALNILSYCKENNKTIPTDLRLISFNDCIAFLYHKPEISSLETPVQLISKSTVEQLMKRIDSEIHRGNHILHPCTFNTRESH